MSNTLFRKLTHYSICALTKSLLLFKLTDWSAFSILKKANIINTNLIWTMPSAPVLKQQILEQHSSDTTIYTNNENIVAIKIKLLTINRWGVISNVAKTITLDSDIFPSVFFFFILNTFPVFVYLQYYRDTG